MLFDFEYSNISGFLTIACVIVTLFYLFSNVRKRNVKLPPGPMGLPIVGYMPFLTNLPHLKLAKLATKYGNIFSLRLGSSFVVVLNKGKIIREAFSKPEFLGRPPEHVLNTLENFKSPFLSNGKPWQEQRRFALQSMRDLGFGKSRMEKHILDEIECVLEVIKQSDGTPIDVKEKLTPSMSNNICSLVFGSRYKYDDPERLFLDKTLETVTRSVQQLTPLVFFPWLKKLPFAGMFIKQHELVTALGNLRQFMKKHIDNHEKTLDSDNIRDYIDGYLMEMKNRKETDPETTFSHDMLTGSVMNFFGAGSETVRTTVDWCLYAMAVFRNFQQKVQAEIDENIGRERMPSWLDRREMPFTEAVLREMHRWQTVVPINLVRSCLADTELQGYHIPKGTVIFANFWSVHHDPEDWEHPFEFTPDRFLCKDGKTVVKPEPHSYMPFSIGKRSCPGEILALIEVFLYFTSVLQRYTVEIPEGAPVSFEGEVSLTYRLKPHTLCFKRRP